jgi:hypothetical protein
VNIYPSNASLVTVVSNVNCSGSSISFVIPESIQQSYSAININVTNPGDGTWSNPVYVPIVSQSTGVTWMNPGVNFAPGMGIYSPSGQYQFVYQGDGNVVFYGPGGALWSSGTANTALGSLAMQGDGNLVLNANSGSALWNSGTQGNSGAKLAVQDDGSLVIYAADGVTPLSYLFDNEPVVYNGGGDSGGGGG